jgi:hypothetical protein
MKRRVVEEILEPFRIVCDLTDSEFPVNDEDQHGEFIADAFTLYHETGLTPREILAQRDYALSVLAEYEKALEYGPENLSYRRYEEISEKATVILPLFATLDATTPA